MVNLTRFNRESISSLNGTQTYNFYEVLREMHSSYSLTITHYVTRITIDSPDLAIINDSCFFDSVNSEHSFTLEMPLGIFVSLLLNKKVLYNDFVIKLNLSD